MLSTGSFFIPLGIFVLLWNLEFAMYLVTFLLLVIFLLNTCPIFVQELYKQKKLENLRSFSVCNIIYLALAIDLNANKDIRFLKTLGICGVSPSVM